MRESHEASLCYGCVGIPPTRVSHKIARTKCCLTEIDRARSVSHCATREARRSFKQGLDRRTGFEQSTNPERSAQAARPWRWTLDAGRFLFSFPGLESRSRIGKNLAPVS